MGWKLQKDGIFFFFYSLQIESLGLGMMLRYRKIKIVLFIVYYSFRTDIQIYNKQIIFNVIEILRDEEVVIKQWGGCNYFSKEISMCKGFEEGRDIVC